MSKSWNDNSSNPFHKATTDDLSHLGDGLNPFRESQANGNTLSEKGPLQLPGSPSEQTSDLGLDPKHIGQAPSLGSDE